MIARTRKVPLRSLPDFFASATRKRSANFLWYFFETSRPVRLNVRVPKAIVKNAVVRNALKRAVYDAFPYQVAKTGDIVVVQTRALSQITRDVMYDQYRQVTH